MRASSLFRDNSTSRKNSIYLVSRLEESCLISYAIDRNLAPGRQSYSIMSRQEDSTSGLRSFLDQSDCEDGEQPQPDPLVPHPLSFTESFPHADDERSRPSTAMGDNPGNLNRQTAGSKLLTPEETIELARHALESGIQDTKRSLAGSEAVTDVVKPKLTIDLGHSHIVRIPEPVVDIIKDEVERYVSAICADFLAFPGSELQSFSNELTNLPEDFPFQTTISSISRTGFPSAPI